ncbi:MAG: hypothetical protein U0Y10_23445 [Spirosomataceae bacterium]
MKKIVLFALLLYASGADAQQASLGIGEYLPEPSDEFELCTKPPYTHYHFLPYEGGVRAVHDFVRSRYVPVTTDQSGYLTVRCLLNCQNQVGAFRTLSVNTDYQACTFDPQIVNQLMALSKQLPHWKAQNYYNTDKVAEGYVTIIYKIKKGAIEYVLW